MLQGRLTPVAGMSSSVIAGGLDDVSDKAMRKLDKGVAARVFDELDEIAKLKDPRSRGKALTGNLAGVWRYRVGDYRILCDINDGRLVILVVDVAHRREVYGRR